MTLPALSPRGFWTRVAVFGASLVVYMWAVLIMAREDSLVGVCSSPSGLSSASLGSS
jgi:hypothetical protein